MPLALITGASVGLGAEFARQLAASGHDLVLVARDGVRLERARRELSARHGVMVDVLLADLGTDDGCASVERRIADTDRPVDLLVNNAGIGIYAAFGKTALADEERQLDLNVRAVVRLSHAAVRVMTERNQGRIVNVSSVAGFVPRGGNATYAASKAYVTLFSESLALQLRDAGVSVTAVHPGFTRTEFHKRATADMSHVPKALWLSPEVVVREGLADAMRGKVMSVPTRRYRTLLLLVRLVPRSLLRRVMARRGF